jgi:hypothetical protein
MPLRWTIDAGQQTIDIVAEGDVTISDVMAFFDDIEKVGALAYKKLLDGIRARPAMSAEDLLAMAARIRYQHGLSAVGPLAVVASAEQAQAFARVLGAAAVADRPLKVFDEIRPARRWLDAQPPRHP